jgi:hypothetical protein
MSAKRSILAIAAVALAASMPPAELRASEAVFLGSLPQSPGLMSQAAPQSATGEPSPTLPGSAPAEPAGLPEYLDGRFAFYQRDDAFVRLDRRTGEVASCSRRTDGWACVTAAEDRTALDQKIERLQRDNAVLKQALLERGLPLPDGMAGSPSAASPAAEAAPSGGSVMPRPPQTVPPNAASPPASPPQGGEADHATREEVEIDRIMKVVDSVWRRVVDMARTMQRDLQKKE